MNNSLLKFGETLKELRIKSNLSLREVCKKVGYDASNWSKIERGKISPPSDETILQKWAENLGLKKNTSAYIEFIDQAVIAQGIIPGDILEKQSATDCLPAFFRTLRNKKPTKEEIDHLIELLRNV